MCGALRRGLLRLDRPRFPAVLCDPQRQWAFSYNAAGDVVEQRDPLGNAQTVVPDAMGRPVGFTVSSPVKQTVLARMFHQSLLYGPGGANGRAIGAVWVV